MAADPCDEGAFFIYKILVERPNFNLVVSWLTLRLNCLAAPRCEWANDGLCDARYDGDWCPLGSDVVDCADYSPTCGPDNEWQGDGL